MYIFKTLSAYGINFGMGIIYGVNDIVYITCTSRSVLNGNRVHDVQIEDITYGVSGEKFFCTLYRHFIIEGIDDIL